MPETNSKKSLSGNPEIKNLHGRKRLQYIWDYYKLPIVVFLILLYVVIYCIYGHVTRKDTILYTAFVNVAASEELTGQLTSDFLEYQTIDTRKDDLYLYKDLYLTDDENNEYHQYTYASRMKILGAIDAEELDVVFMNKEAFDAFSQNGYLCDLSSLLLNGNVASLEKISPYLEKNTVILQDNSVDLYFDENASYEATTQSYVMGINLSHAPLIQQAGFDEPVYLGVIANSPRKEMAIDYIQYLFQESP